MVGHEKREHVIIIIIHFVMQLPFSSHKIALCDCEGIERETASLHQSLKARLQASSTRDETKHEDCSLGLQLS